MQKNTTNKTSSRTAIVIGAGFGGLAAALRLRALGYQVTVLDKLDSAGGRARIISRGKFHYDAGPTVLTAPILFEELFSLFNEKLENSATLLPVEPWYRMQFDDGATLDYNGNDSTLLAEIAKFSPADAQNYPKFKQHTEAIFKQGYEKYGAVAFNSWSMMFRALPALLRLRADRSVYHTTAHFFKHDAIRRAFSIQPLLVGGNPFNTTSIYSLIHFLERKWGVWFVKGGMGAMVQALVDLGVRHGIKYSWNQTVVRLSVDQALQKINGVVLQNGENIAADLVVTNTDPAWIHRSWLNEQSVSADTTKILVKPSFLQSINQRVIQRINHWFLNKRYKQSMSLFVWYFSTRKQYTEVKHHTILFGKTYRETLQHIFNGNTVPTDLSVYLHRPNATDLQSTDYDSFYALVPVPNLKADINWKIQGELLKAHLCKTLEDKILPDLHKELVDDFFITPEYFKEQLMSEDGAAFGIQPTFLQSAKFRYANQHKRYKNLFFVGANTHPGAGVPGVLLSAKVLESLLKAQSVA